MGKNNKSKKSSEEKSGQQCEVCKKSVLGGTWGKFKNEKVFHVGCFTCHVCRVFLTESNVQIRNGKVYCNAHAIYQVGNQPVAMVFYRWMSYRVVYSEKKAEADAKRLADEEGEVDEDEN